MTLLDAPILKPPISPYQPPEIPIEKRLKKYNETVVNQSWHTQKYIEGMARDATDSQLALRIVRAGMLWQRYIYLRELMWRTGTVDERLGTRPWDGDPDFEPWWELVAP